MRAYIYAAALHCEDCGEKIKADLIAAGKAPADPDDEYSYDSDDFPKGPDEDGGGEADSPQHCDTCHVFLENPLTTDGCRHTREMILDADGDWDVEKEWRDHYGDDVATETEMVAGRLAYVLRTLNKEVSFERLIESWKSLPTTTDQEAGFLNTRMAIEHRNRAYDRLLAQMKEITEASEEWLADTK